MYRVVDGVASDLVLRARANDADALGELLAELRPRVFRYCLARLGDPHLADDVTQEVTMTVVTALPRYVDQGKPFTAFVFGIAANKVSESRRGVQRRREDVTGVVPDEPDRSAGPEQALLRLEATRGMLGLLGELSERQAEVVRLRVAVGLSVEETAQALGITGNAVRVTQHRALTRLRQLLAERR